MSASQLDPLTHSRLKLLYMIWALVLIGLGTAILLPVVNQIGDNYGGFIWMYDSTRQPPFFVSFELWRSQPPTPTEIRFLDEIETIDGLSPWAFDQVYEQASPGDLISYVVRRDNDKLLIREPVRVFTIDKFVISHGLLYLAGLLYVLAGYMILRNTKRKDFTIFAFIFLFGGSAWLGHGDVWGVHAPYVGNEALNLIFFTPSAPMTAAILAHFVAYYPQPKPRVLKSHFFPWLLYALAFLFILSYTLTRAPVFARLNQSLMVGMFVCMIIAIMILLASSLKSYLSARWQKNDRQRRILEPMIIASMVGFLIFVFVGIAPVLIIKYTLVPFEIWIALMLVVPLIFIYAINNSELVNHLRQEVILRQQYSDQVEELHNIRERTLHEVSDALHDYVIPELRGLHFAATAAQRQAASLGQEALSDDIAFISTTLDALSKETRVIMEGAKPINWEDVSLGQALRWLTAGLLLRVPEMVVDMDTAGYDENDDAAIKESLYWITRAAVSNVQEHARAARVKILLTSDAQTVKLRITDNGVGFDPQSPNSNDFDDRRHLGLTNMRLRAQEINARLRIDSSPDAGVDIKVIVPRGGRP